MPTASFSSRRVAGFTTFCSRWMIWTRSFAVSQRREWGFCRPEPEFGLARDGHSWIPRNGLGSCLNCGSALPDAIARPYRKTLNAARQRGGRPQPKKGFTREVAEKRCQILWRSATWRPSTPGLLPPSLRFAPTPIFGPDDRKRTCGGVLSVCTQHTQHVPPVETAVPRGVHEIVEKPLAVDLPSCDRAIAAARAGGVKLGVISQRRVLWRKPLPKGSK
jgi:hypothetical protein